MGDEAALCKRTAQAVSEGKVIGWFHGRLEWGPRALGNRFILGDPRRADIVDILNLKIKRRESFRPFAPSILRDAVKDWFETDDDVPFMVQVFKTSRPSARRFPPSLGPPPDRHLGGQSALCAPDRGVPWHHRRADRAQHQLQRERAGGVRARGGHRLLPAHQIGRACPG
jgi:carbamoyltransferase-like protein